MSTPAPTPSPTSAAPADSLDRRFLLGGLAGVAGISALAAMSQRAAAGPLEPPAGAVASTPGPEPRTAVNATNTPGNAAYAFRITQPGSYYLPANIIVAAQQSGIEIAASNVTLDLNGFTIQGNYNGSNASAVSGIVYSALSAGGITVANGQISNWGQSAVLIQWTLAGPVVLRNLVVAGAGAIGIDAACPAVRLSDTTMRGCVTGAQLGPGALVERCTAHGNATRGLVVGSASMVSDCTAYANNDVGIVAGGGAAGSGGGCTVSRCVVANNTGAGISVGQGSSLIACAAYGNLGIGLAAANSSLVLECTSIGNTGAGISVANSCTVRASNASSNTGAGVAAVDGCLVESCTSSGNAGSGISVHLNSTVRNNECSGNSSPGTGGIILTTAVAGGNRIEGNLCSGNSRGFYAQSAGNLFLRNTASGNSVPWSIPSGNYLQVVIPAAAAAVNGQTGGTALASSGYDSNLNFTL